jgi:hypothetical protein
MKLAASVIAAVLAAANAASAQDVSGRADAVVRGTDYCLEVVEAGFAGRGAVLTGPEGFREEREPYGQLNWLYGESDHAPAMVMATPDTEHCTVIAVSGASVDDALKALVAGKDGFVADNREGTQYHRSVNGGWIRVGWTVVEMEGEGRGPLWVMVSSMKESD